jgi:hypothetical protein
MNEIFNLIEVYHISDVEKVAGSEVFLKNDNALILSTDDFLLTPKNSTTDAGTLYIIEETITTDKVPDDIALHFKYSRSVILKIKTTKGNYIVGSLEYPAKVTITQHLNKSQLILKSQSPKNPF